MKRINLLVKQGKYIKLEHAFGKLKWVLILFVVFFTACYVFISFLLFDQKKVIDSLSQEKEVLLEFLLALNKVEAKFVYFRTKEQQLSDILKDDVNFYPYYKLLDQTLKSLSSSAVLESVTINKLREAEFTLSFPDSKSMISFFKFAESDDFLKNFNTLVLTQFTQIQAESQQFELIFKGTFIALNEN